MINQHGCDAHNCNGKLTAASARLIKIVLVLLVIWSLMAIGWIIHLILKSTPLSSTRDGLLFKRSLKEDPEIKFENLVFSTSIKVTDETNWDRIKMIIGCFHRLSDDSEQVPLIKIHIQGKIDEMHLKEASAWHKVKFIFNESDGSDGSIWMSSKYIFDSIVLDLKRAELVSEADTFIKAHYKGRKLIETLMQNCVELVDSGRIVLKNMSGKCRIGQGQRLEANSVGFVRISEATPSMKCHVALKQESIVNGAKLVNFNDFANLKRLERLNSEKSKPLKRLAIAVPTTSKGMSKDHKKHVLLTALIPSIRATLSIEEMERFRVVIFIGFDEGDEMFENDTWRHTLEGEISKHLKVFKGAISVVFLRLLPLSRVAMTWNMIFAFARQLGKFDYFYQVNDDLTMKDSDWLSRFTSKIDSWNGIGVVGPSDSFNGFNCSLLTQSFVSERHFEFFGEMFYPLAFRDWKSDRWLSFVYGDNNTACWPEINATNGASGTRYEACPFPEWKIYLKQGQETISNKLT
jgi:hypothetical protein